MIRHNPFGSGHPYINSNDQRIPVLPEVGKTLELRVYATDDIAKISVEWDDGIEKSILALRRRNAPKEKMTVASDGTTHLSNLMSDDKDVKGSWCVRTLALSRQSQHRYRFLSIDVEGATRRTKWFKVTPAKWVKNAGTLNVSGDSRVIETSVELLVNEEGCHQVRFDFALMPDQHVVGFGERFNAVDQRGVSLDAVVCEQYKNQAFFNRTYMPMPFAMVIGQKSWSFFVRTSQRTWYDVGASAPDRLKVTVDLSEHDRGPLDLVFDEGEPTALLNNFLGLVGRPEKLPDWVFGLWASGNEWNTQEQILEILENHKEQDIPLGVVVIEAWSDESTFTAFRDSEYAVREDGKPHKLEDFSFPADGAWPDPKRMVDQLHENGTKVLLWQIPLLKMRPSPKGQADADAKFAKANNLLVTLPDGSPYRNRAGWFESALMPDFTSPEARKWWLERRRYLVEELGVDGFKTDGGEHGWGVETRYAAGSQGVGGNNLFPVHYAKAYGDLLRSCEKAPVTFSRAGFTGSQSNGVFWAGDEESTWDALRNSLNAGITASACGVFYWGWDLAGFSGEIPTPELYLRSTAIACFSPIMQYHSEFNFHRLPSRDRTPWNIADRTGDESVVRIFRKFAHLRQRLFPYLSEQMEFSIQKGAPLMRGLFFDFAGDGRIWNYPHQYLLGSDLLVAPVTKPDVTSWPVYLPSGEWVDVWTGKVVTGPAEIECSACLDEIPVFARSESWERMKEYFSL